MDRFWFPRSEKRPFAPRFSVFGPSFQLSTTTCHRLLEFEPQPPSPVDRARRSYPPGACQATVASNVPRAGRSAPRPAPPSASQRPLAPPTHSPQSVTPVARQFYAHAPSRGREQTGVSGSAKGTSQLAGHCRHLKDGRATRSFRRANFRQEWTRIPRKGCRPPLTIRCRTMPDLQTRRLRGEPPA